MPVLRGRMSQAPGAQVNASCSDELASARSQMARLRERLVSLLKGRPGELTERARPSLQRPIGAACQLGCSVGHLTSCLDRGSRAGCMDAGLGVLPSHARRGRPRVVQSAGGQAVPAGAAGRGGAGRRAGRHAHGRFRGAPGGGEPQQRPGRRARHGGHRRGEDPVAAHRGRQRRQPGRAGIAGCGAPVPRVLACAAALPGPASPEVAPGSRPSAPLPSLGHAMQAACCGRWACWTLSRHARALDAGSMASTLPLCPSPGRMAGAWQGPRRRTASAAMGRTATSFSRL